MDRTGQVGAARTRIGRILLAAGMLAGLAAVLAPLGKMQPAAHAGPQPRSLPAAPASGEMGFIVASFGGRIVPGEDACPDGTVPRLRDAYLLTLPAAERERLKRPENAKEWDEAWQAYATNEAGANICTNPDMFERPPMPTVKSRYAWGMDLDGGNPGERGCAHENFVSPDGEQGIDNQEYRVMGCTPEARGADGKGEGGSGTGQFHRSGEWTQVILLRGVDSLVRDDAVEVIYANTGDRAVTSQAGEVLPGASYLVDDKPPRNRNVLRGRIVDGVLTTEPADIKLAQTWGQSRQRDLRGARSKYDYRSGRLRLKFQPDGSLTGMLGGYRPVFDLIAAPAIGGIGSATVAGIDCAQQLATARKFADGLRDPKTGKCTAVSSAAQIRAVPAFVIDVPRK
jgi:hypothetical protein